MVTQETRLERERALPSKPCSSLPFPNAKNHCSSSVLSSPFLGNERFREKRLYPCVETRRGTVALLLLMLWPLGVQVGEVAQVLVAVEQQVQVPADLRPESLSFNPQLILSVYSLNSLTL